MAVPKKKTARSSSKTRYSHYLAETQKKLKNRVHLVDCQTCGSKKLSHCVCDNCGKYKGKEIIQKKHKQAKVRIEA